MMSSKPWYRRLWPFNPSPLQEARSALELAETRQRLKLVEQRSKLLESSFSDAWGWGTLFDPRDYYDGWDAPTPPTIIAQPGDRARGDEWPLYRTEGELFRLIQQSRVLCRTNAYAKGLLKNLTNYVIGKGFEFAAASKELLPDADPNKPGKQASAQVTRHVAAVQDVIDKCFKANRWRQRQREIFRRTRRDGDAFIRLFRQDDGTTLLRFIDPACVRNPPGAQPGDGWSWGIRHDVDGDGEDVETILEYYVVDKTDSGQGEYIDASEIVHIKNVDEDSDVKRGLPDFVWDTLDAFKRAAKVQSHSSIGAAIRAAIAEHWEHTGFTGPQINDLAAGPPRQQRVNPQTGRTENIENIPAGTVRRVPEGSKLVPTPAGNTAEHQAAAQGDLRQGATAFTAPETLASADASNGNYSSLETAAAPWVRCGETDQEHYKDGFLEVIDRILANAVEGGLLEPEALDVVEVQVTAPAVLHRNELEATQKNQIAVMTGWKSRQTACEEDGGDWEQEQGRILEYNDQMGQAGGTLPLPGDAGNPPEPPTPSLPAGGAAA